MGEGLLLAGTRCRPAKRSAGRQGAGRHCRACPAGTARARVARAGPALGGGARHSPGILGSRGHPAAGAPGGGLGPEADRHFPAVSALAPGQRAPARSPPPPPAARPGAVANPPNGPVPGDRAAEAGRPEAIPAIAESPPRLPTGCRPLQLRFPVLSPQGYGAPRPWPAGRQPFLPEWAGVPEPGPSGSGSAGPRAASR